MENRLKQIRQDLGMTQQQLAELCDTSNQQIQRLEAGERRLSDVWIEKISTALKIPVWYLFVDPETMPNEEDMRIISAYNKAPEHMKQAVRTILFVEN